MKYRPDEPTLISYLYGELDETQMQKLQKHFEENPEELKQLQQMKAVLGVLENVDEKEVIAPPVFMDDDSNVRSFWGSTSFRTIASIAASFLLIIVAARLLGTQISYGNSELRISFGGAPKVEQVDKPAAYAGLTEQQVQNLIDASLSKNNEATDAKLAENQRKIDQTIRQNLASNSQRVHDLVQQASVASQEQVRTFVAGLRNENLQSVRDYLQLSATDQKKYMENLLVDFSKYLQEQRNQDLQMFQTRFSTIEQNTDVFKQETEQILASIISSSTTNQKQSDY